MESFKTNMQAENLTAEFIRVINATKEVNQ
jgi:hypothetical protein